ncbi:COMM domain-containing protein 10 [Lamellibrachia satsuma]|nr:COMM domain-containing protein 10 [Lamellibrachia satsuma]
MALMFTETANIKKAVALINGLDCAKFPLLLSRILQKLHLKGERTFTEQEEEKLESALSLPPQDLQLVIETCEFILQQAAYHIAKPAVLSKQLQRLGFDDDKVAVFVDAWTNNAASVTQKLRHRSIAPKQLEEINWRLSLQMGQATQSKMKLPNAMFELTVKDDNTQVKDKVRMEFTHEELYTFYNQLETIQAQLDTLS